MTADRYGAAEEKEVAMNGVRISDLIAAPLTAAADAQSELALRTVEFIRGVGMETDENGRTAAKNISFGVKAPSGDGDGTKEIEVSAPLLAVVPVPSLAVEEIDVGFQMEVTSAQNGGDGSGIVMCGQVSSSADQTRESNQSAKYQISVKARRQQQSEGLSRLLDILASVVQGV
ncbi:MAG: DUF2589 domain-containing protein [Treponemataceae bacterium]|nr:DUF2589 domain-containing protein [Treponemataceae bacterium]MDE7228591.1 DUF2589 domain-containing protein [Treponemataceae bacterium]